MKIFTEKKVLWGCILLYIVVFGIFTSMRHYNFQTQTWDMAAFIQTFWNTTQGRIMFNNLEEVPNHLGVHMSPWLFVLVPGYALFQSPYYLLILQTIALALGAWPLYLLAKHILRSSRWALLLAIGYLLYPSLHWINTFDFHSVSFLIPFLLAAFYFIEVKRWGWASFFLVLSAATREDSILVVLFVGVYLLIRHSIKEVGQRSWLGANRKMGLAITFLAFIYFILSIQFIMPALGGGLLRVDRYAALGETPSKIVQNVISEPSLLIETVVNKEKIAYTFWLFLPIAFLPLVAGAALILILPGLAENLLTSFEFQFSGLYQYDAVLVAGLFIATIYGIAQLLKRSPKKSKIFQWVFIGFIATGFLFRSPLNPVSFPITLFQSNPHWETFRKLIKSVPPNASVAAHTNLVPHLSHREHAYPLGSEPFPVDVVIVDGADFFGFPDASSFEAYVNAYYYSGDYESTAINNRYLILRKK